MLPTKKRATARIWGVKALSLSDNQHELLATVGAGSHPQKHEADLIGKNTCLGCFLYPAGYVRRSANSMFSTLPAPGISLRNPTQHLSSLTKSDSAEGKSVCLIDCQARTQSERSAGMLLSRYEV